MNKYHSNAEADIKTAVPSFSFYLDSASFVTGEVPHVDGGAHE